MCAIDVTGILQKSGYKITKPRIAVMEVLAKAETPLSPYDIRKKLPQNLSINTVTIYRILDLFKNLGLVHRTHTKEGYVSCESQADKGCHYLVVCKKCSRVDEFTVSNCAVKDNIPKSLPFKNLEHLSEISGICDSCSK